MSLCEMLKLNDLLTGGERRRRRALVVVLGAVSVITHRPSGCLSSLLPEKRFYSPAGCQGRAKAEGNESHGALGGKKNLSKVWGVEWFTRLLPA